ncbi:hypothetical protein H2199_006679 [Coniosporium tulheliwenetii]|uniref:Uncharacterized protein n=1 Tax=Coniosporium tulheliwenetii TaxID=3383036 RepID=A0ACC2YTX5_9PEZI|nr:hypothetical protein H2199_006679 [Cladosporium sp. JES 115]
MTTDNKPSETGHSETQGLRSNNSPASPQLLHGSPEAISDRKRKFNVFSRLHNHISMGPRKKSQPDSKAPAADTIETPTSTNDDNAASSSNPLEPNGQAKSTDLPETAPRKIKRSDTGNSTKTLRAQDGASGTSSWYGGSWRSKASPVAQVTRESISKRRASKSSLIAPSMTKLHVTSSSSTGLKTEAEEDAARDKDAKDAQLDPPLPPDPLKTQDGAGDNETKSEQQEASKAPAVTSYWRGWWSKPDADAAETPKSKDAAKDVSAEEARRTPLPGSTPVEETVLQSKAAEPVSADPTVAKSQLANGDVKPAAPGTQDESKDKGSQSRSWFWLWSSAENAKSNPPSTEEQQPQEAASTAETQAPAKDVPSVVEPPQAQGPAEDASVPSKTAAEEPRKSSAWAFWLREKPDGDTASDTASTHKQIGELAVADTPSQSHPEAAQFNEPAPKIRGRKPSKQITSTPSTPAKVSPSDSPALKPADQQPPVKETQTTKAAVPLKPPQPNLLLPNFYETYRPAPTTSYWQSFRRYFVANKEPDTPHLHINPSPPRVKKALAIGVHGYFPAPLIQKVLGQPTGTSIRFANSAAVAIKKWTEEKGYEAEIEKVALEGEGFVAERVELLWKLLLNWIEKIRQADFVLVACHSQGVPVAIMLVAKLVQFGCLHAGTRVGVCAMAGVNMGPFPELKIRFLGATAQELFEFGRADSAVSKMYRAALETVLGAGVRIVYTGSIDDQLVSLESSTFIPLTHPSIYRAVFVDGRLHTASFLTSLIGFVLKLRNLGLPDHGVIRELSPRHSRIYDDPAVYQLAVRFALETLETADMMKGVKVEVEYAEGNGENGVPGSNPYFLPWAMRGLLEEEYVKREMGKEVEELLGLFEEWRPVSKGLKDVRFRLEAVRSKF